MQIAKPSVAVSSSRVASLSFYLLPHTVLHCHRPNTAATAASVIVVAIVADVGNIWSNRYSFVSVRFHWFFDFEPNSFGSRMCMSHVNPPSICRAIHFAIKCWKHKRKKTKNSAAITRAYYTNSYLIYLKGHFQFGVPHSTHTRARARTHIYTTD